MKIPKQAISFEMDVMNTAGRTRAIDISASLLVRHKSKKKLVKLQ